MVTDPLFGRAQWKNDDLEKDFQSRVVQLLSLEGWRVFSIPDSRRATLKGYPDLTCWHPKTDRLVFIELKREKGRVSPEQKVVLEELGRITETYLFRPSDWSKIVAIAEGKKP